MISVKVYLKCNNCGEEFTEECKPVLTVREAMVYLGFKYHHECEFNPQSHAVFGTAEMKCVKCDFKELSK